MFSNFSRSRAAETTSGGSDGSVQIRMFGFSAATASRPQQRAVRIAEYFIMVYSSGIIIIMRPSEPETGSSKA